MYLLFFIFFFTTKDQLFLILPEDFLGGSDGSPYVSGILQSGNIWESTRNRMLALRAVLV